jgi:hypothetical protein
MPYTAVDRETPADCLAAAVVALQTAQHRSRSHPALQTELARLITRVADLRGALLVKSRAVR